MTPDPPAATFGAMGSDAAGARVLLVDDDVELSAMLRQYLETEGFEVGVDFTGGAAVETALSGAYDLIILDVMLPNQSGIELLRRIRAESAIPVVMLTAKGDGVDRVVGLELGADDYVAKPYYPRELVARIRAVLRRRAQPPGPQTGEVFSLGALQVDVPARRAAWADAPLALTPSEFNMLAALLACGDRVATKDHLSLTVLGRAREAYDRSVDVHISNLRQKLAAASGGALDVETVRGVGFRLKARP
jgi:two-component system OmpR family response regulator